MGAMLNGQPRRTVRSRRSSSIIAQAIAVLAKYGGSWWQSGPEYSFTGSDGTGAAGDGSDVGYGVDRCATYGPELVPANWIGINSSLTNQGLSVVKTANTAADTISIALSGTAAAAFSDPISNLLSGNIPTSGGELFELAAMGSESVTPAGATTKLLLVEMNASFNYLRGTLVQLGSKAVVSLGADCKAIRLAVYVGNWTVGAAVSANITLQKPSLRQLSGRPLFQSTTGFKPKLKRVPKRLGAELVSNGDFASGTAGWSVSGSTIAAVAGELEVTNTATSNAQAFQPVPTTAGKVYSVSGTYRRGTAETNAQLMVNNNGSFPSVGVNTTTSNLTYTATLTAASNQLSVIALIGATTTGKTAYFDNISVREVLEWTWAWVFDGVDDRLATVSLPTADAETVIVAGQFLNTTASVQGIISKRNSNTGLMIRRENSLITTGYAMQGSAPESAALDGVPSATSKRVYSVAAASGNKRYRRDGAQVNTTTGAYTSYAGILSLGAEISSANAACNIYAAAYAPVAIPDAELLIIERAMAQLGGITI